MRADTLLVEAMIRVAHGLEPAVVLGCHYAKPFAQVDGILIQLLLPNRVIRGEGCDR